MRCWGKGLAGRLGYGNERQRPRAARGAAGQPGPRPVRPARVAAGDFHTCAILDDGSVRCWGFGANGRLGYGNTANVLSPASRAARRPRPGAHGDGDHRGRLAHLRDPRQRLRALLGQRACRPARLRQPARRSATTRRPAVARARSTSAPAARAVAISAGDFHTCAILDNGALLLLGLRLPAASSATGHDHGHRRRRDARPRRARSTSGGHAARAVSGGTGHTCAILDDGSVRCWGFGADGRLGYGIGRRRSTTRRRPRPRSTSAPGAPPSRSPRARPTPARCSTTAPSAAGASAATAASATATATRSATTARRPRAPARSTSAPAARRGRITAGFSPLLRAARRRDPALLGLRRRAAAWATGTSDSSATTRPAAWRPPGRCPSGRRSPRCSPTCPSASRPPPCSSPSARRPPSPCGSSTPGPTRRRASRSRCPRPRG